MKINKLLIFIALISLSLLATIYYQYQKDDKKNLIEKNKIIKNTNKKLIEKNKILIHEKKLTKSSKTDTIDLTHLINPNYIFSNKAVGKITQFTSNKKLIELFGKEFVAFQHMKGTYDSDGSSFDYFETKVSSDPYNLTIRWADGEKMTNINYIVLASKTEYGQTSEALKKNSIWRTKSGVGLGVTVKQLELLNRRAFSIHGYEVDRECSPGLAGLWNGGNLENELKGISLTLNPQEPIANDYYKLIGCKKISSSKKEMLKVNPVVDHIVINFDN